MNTAEQSPKTPNPKSKLNLTLDLRILCLALLLVIVAMLLVWKPWSAAGISDRVVEVKGEAKITAVPDEFVFYPNYSFKNADKDTALAELTKKSDELVARLKALGVADKQIKTNSSGNDYRLYYPTENSDSLTYNLQLTVTVSNKELAQKVQDYLVSTSPTGSVSPQAGFSDAKQKELEAKARDEATKDARKKADQMADNLGFKVGKVKSLSDNQGFGISPMEGRSGLSVDSAETSKKLNIQPGENDINYTVTVTYYIR